MHIENIKTGDLVRIQDISGSLNTHAYQQFADTLIPNPVMSAKQDMAIELYRHFSGRLLKVLSVDPPYLLVRINDSKGSPLLLDSRLVKIDRVGKHFAKSIRKINREMFANVQREQQESERQ